MNPFTSKLDFAPEIGALFPALLAIEPSIRSIGVDGFTRHILIATAEDTISVPYERSLDPDTITDLCISALLTVPSIRIRYEQTQQEIHPVTLR